MKYKIIQADSANEVEEQTNKFLEENKDIELKFVSSDVFPYTDIQGYSHSMYICHLFYENISSVTSNSRGDNSKVRSKLKLRNTRKSPNSG